MKHAQMTALAERPPTQQSATKSPVSARAPAGHKRAKVARRAGPDFAYAFFLDFDGVLHPTTIKVVLETDEVAGTTLFGWVPVLVKLLKPHPDVALVISSTWRYTHNLEELRGVLGELGPKVVGVTPRGQRYESIRWFLQLNPQFASHRILDDALSEFLDPPPKELILCDPRTGVSSTAVLCALQNWLNERE